MAISRSAAFADFRTVFWSTAATTTTLSSPRHADATALPTSSRPKWCRSFEFLRTLTGRSRDARAEPWSTWSPSPAPITCTARRFIICATVRSARPIRFLAFKPHNRQQQLGGTIGGPLKRNKIFFFAGFDQHIFHVPNVVEFLNGSSQVIPQAGTGPYTPGDYEAHRSSAGVRGGRATHFARRGISGGADRQLVLCQARHQSHAAQSTRAAREYDAILGSEQRLPRSRQPGHLRLDQRQRQRTGLHRDRYAFAHQQPFSATGSAIFARSFPATCSSLTAIPATC